MQICLLSSCKNLPLLSLPVYYWCCFPHGASCFSLSETQLTMVPEGAVVLGRLGVEEAPEETLGEAAVDRLVVAAVGASWEDQQVFHPS